MATLNELITAKAERLSSVPDELLTSIERSELKLLRELQGLLKELTTKDGRIVQDIKNLERAGLIVDKLRELFYGSDYTDAVAKFALEFDNQTILANEYLQKAFTTFEGSTFAVAGVAKAKENAVKLLIEALPESELFNPVKSILEEAVSSGARYSDTLDALAPYFEGKDGGALKRYANTYAHDAFAISDRSYMNTISDELEAQWFQYSAGTVSGTRAFCMERHEKYFHYKEIEGWANGERVAGERTPDSNGDWQGKIEGTSEQTIFTYAGGWNCRHSIVPVSILVVPRSVIERNIAIGNFEPSDFERKELGLN